MARGTRGPWLLVRAAEAGDAQLVARLLGEGRDVNEADEFGCTALMMASEDGHVEVVRLLLARQGVEVNKSATDGAAALIMASQGSPSRKSVPGNSPVTFSVSTIRRCR